MQTKNLIVLDNIESEDFIAESVSLPNLFREQVQTQPDKKAVICGDEFLTYRELAQISSRLGSYLLHLGASVDECIGVFLEPSLELMVGIWGILLSGSAYLPLSPEYPEDRLRYMVKDAGVKRWKRPVSLLVFTAWQLVVGGAMLMPIALVVEGPLTNLTKTNLQAFIYLGVIGTGIAYTLWFRGIGKLQVSAVSYLGLMSPVTATLIGFFWLGQTFTSIQLIGIVIIFTSVLIGQQTNFNSSR